MNNNATRTNVSHNISHPTMPQLPMHMSRDDVELANLTVPTLFGGSLNGAEATFDSRSEEDITGHPALDTSGSRIATLFVCVAKENFERCRGEGVAAFHDQLLFAGRR